MAVNWHLPCSDLPIAFLKLAGVRRRRRPAAGSGGPRIRVLETACVPHLGMLAPPACDHMYAPWMPRRRRGPSGRARADLGGSGQAMRRHARGADVCSWHAGRSRTRYRHPLLVLATAAVGLGCFWSTRVTAYQITDGLEVKTMEGPSRRSTPPEMA